MPQTTSKKKASWETGFIVVTCPFEAAALIAVGLDLADNTPAVDNVYSDERPWAESGGKFNLSTGKIERAPDYLGSTKFYVRPRNAAGVDAQGCLTYWRDPAPVRVEMQAMPDRFRAATSPGARYSLHEDLRALIPAAQVAFMREAAGEIPVGVWSKYERNEEYRQAEERLAELPERLIRPEADATSLLPNYERDFLPAMHASVQQFFENYLTLRDLMSGVLPAIRLRDVSDTRWPLVLPLGPNFASERQAFTK